MLEQLSDTPEPVDRGITGSQFVELVCEKVAENVSLRRLARTEAVLATSGKGILNTSGRNLMKNPKTILLVVAAVAVVAAAVSPDAQVSCTWTDNPIVSGQTPIKAAHINEIRTCIDRILGDSPPPPPPPPPGQNVSGTWEGTEDALFLPYTWRFVIAETNGRLSGTYTEVTLGSSGSIGGSRNGNNVTITLLSGRYTGGFTGLLVGGVITGEIEYASVVELGPYDLTLRRVQSGAALTDAVQFQERNGEFVELVKACVGFSPGTLRRCALASEQEMIERYGPDWDQP